MALASIGIFLLGLSVGSFLNSLAWRLEKGESVVSHRSYCPHCRHTLSWKDLVPVFSFLLLKGSCRYCQSPISLQYPLVELAAAVVFLLLFYFGFPLSTYLVVALLIAIFVYDLKHYIIPDQFVYSGIAITLLWKIFEVINLNLEVQTGNFEPLINALSAGIIAAAFFFAIYLLSRGKWLGFGDVKLSFLMGLFLGWPNILVALFSSFLIGAVMGLILVTAKKKTIKSQVPFGPFLVAGTLIALFFGENIIQWYMSQLVIL